MTARKQDRVEAVQDVPLAINVYTGEELSQRFANDLMDLNYAAPNVGLMDVGTLRGTANFSIRGQGIISSIPSIDPTVGIFTNGVYLGITTNSMNDLYDIESIEILRGPQGLLFGRNVTGGAVLINTRRPTDEFEASALATYEQGNDETVGLTVSGPIIAGKLSGRLALYHRDDSGWLSNQFDGGDFGAYELDLARPSLTWQVSDDTTVTAIMERAVTRADGAAGKSFAFHDEDEFTFNIDEPGYVATDWTSAFVEITRKVKLGNGTITNLFGWRDMYNDSELDVDATRYDLFVGGGKGGQEQFSNEFRYFGSFRDNTVDVTAGVYWFDQDFDYLERRQLYRESFAPIAQILNNQAIENSNASARARSQNSDLATLCNPQDDRLRPGVNCILPAKTPVLYQTVAEQVSQIPDGIAKQEAQQALLAANAVLSENCDPKDPYNVDNPCTNTWIDSTLGGQQDQKSRGAFFHVDVHATDTTTLNFGLRYSYEKKRAHIATFRADFYRTYDADGDGILDTPGRLLQLPDTGSRCDPKTGVCSHNYYDENSWDSWTPKIGIQYRPSDDMHLYGYWSKGFRSGGYNFRHTASEDPEPFEDERQNSYEVGAKMRWLDGRINTNVALFHNKVKNLQRELEESNITGGVVQRIKNTADATFQGAELELAAVLTEALTLTANAGYTDGEYDSVWEDLNGDNMVDKADEDLDIPRLAEWTYSLGLNYAAPMPMLNGRVQARVNFSHNDDAAANDSNTHRLFEADILDMSVTYETLDGRLQLSLFSKNLLDEVVVGGITTVPIGNFFANDGQLTGLGLLNNGSTNLRDYTFAPIVNEGRRFGVRLTYLY